jgi:hypothetical protein
MDAVLVLFGVLLWCRYGAAVVGGGMTYRRVSRVSPPQRCRVVGTPPSARRSKAQKEIKNTQKKKIHKKETTP